MRTRLPSFHILLLRSLLLFWSRAFPSDPRQCKCREAVHAKSLDALVSFGCQPSDFAILLLDADDAAMDLVGLHDQSDGAGFGAPPLATLNSLERRSREATPRSSTAARIRTCDSALDQLSHQFPGPGFAGPLPRHRR